MQRLDKFLADMSIGTRKQIKEYVKNGAVSVNGEIAKKSDMHIDETKDIVSFMGKELVFEKFHYYMLNKPAGYVSSNREGKSPTVIDILKEEKVKNLSTVGRLDKDTEGLLLITDDGQMIHHLLSPAHHVEKEYEVHIKKELSPKDIEMLEKGLDIGDKKKDGSIDYTLPAKVKIAESDAESAPVIYMSITEGRFHQVKRMLEAVDNEVLYLKRIRMGDIKLDVNLELGKYRRLSDDEIKILQK